MKHYYLKTDEIRNFIVGKSKSVNVQRISEWRFDIFFEKVAPDKPVGIYIYSDRKGYHEDIVGDRGGIICRRTFKKLDELLFSVYDYISDYCAYEYAQKNKYLGVSTRQLQVEKQLEILKTLDYTYYKKKKSELNKQHIL